MSAESALLKLPVDGPPIALMVVPPVPVVFVTVKNAVPPEPIVVLPVADSVLNAPVDGVVAPIAVEFRPVEVKVLTMPVPPMPICTTLPVGAHIVIA